MNARRRRPTILIAAAVTVILLFGLSAAAQAGGTAAHTAAKSPILIGQIVPLTGPFAHPPGAPFRKGFVVGMAGVRLALRQVNAHGGINGRPLKLIVVDDASTSAGGIEAVTRLAHKHLTAIIGPGQSSEILAMLPYIRQARIPMIIGGTLPALTHQGNPWVFRTRPSGIYSNRALTTFAVRTLHLSRIALLELEPVPGLPDLLRDDLAALGVAPVAEQFYSQLASDLTAQVLAIKKSGATGLIMQGGQPADFRLMDRQMHEAGMHLTWLGNPSLALAATLPGFSAYFHGTYSVTDYIAAQSPEAAAFNRELEHAFHLPGGFPEAFAYDGLHILARVIRKVGTNPQAIRRGILSLRNYRGAEGTYNFDRHGDGLHQDTVVKNVNGHLHFIKVLSF